jgi:hypothetical protein
MHRLDSPDVQPLSHRSPHRFGDERTREQHGQQSQQRTPTPTDGLAEATAYRRLGNSLKHLGRQPVRHRRHHGATAEPTKLVFQ